MRLIEHFFRVLAPVNCLHCGSEGAIVCGWCIDDALPQVPGRCYRCNTLTLQAAVCRTCRRQSPLKHLWKRTEYNATARNLVHAMKFKYSVEAAEFIAAELAHILPALPPDTIIVHVPAATSHVRQRGFDHAAMIAGEISRLTGLPALPALARVGQQRQVGSGRQQRLRQMRGAFRKRQGQVVRNARILLVDDVLTTGATMESAAQTLKSAGACSVDGIVFASAR